MVVSGVVVWGASLRVEGVGAEGLALQFLGFTLLLDPWGRGCLFWAGALLVHSKNVCVGEALCLAQAIMS